MSNWKRYKLEGSAGREVMPEHRARKLLRGLEFATRICNGESIRFGPPEGEATIAGIQQAIEELEDAYENGGMPDSPGTVYRDWLHRIRIEEMGSW